MHRAFFTSVSHAKVRGIGALPAPVRAFTRLWGTNATNLISLMRQRGRKGERGRERASEREREIERERERERERVGLTRRVRLASG